MSEFVEFLNEVFEAFGPITTRKIFGGYGIYHSGVMFALVFQDVLYLKADQETRSHFDLRGLPAFQYSQKEKAIHMSYFLAPEEIYEDREEAAMRVHFSNNFAHTGEIMLASLSPEDGSDLSNVPVNAHEISG